MNTRRIHPWGCAPALAVVAMTPVLFAGEGPPIAPPPARIPTYTFMPIGTLPGYEQAFVNDINNAGHVVGTAWRIESGAPHQQAFLFDDGTIRSIGTSPMGSGAEGINDLGHIVGFDSAPESGRYAFHLDDDGLVAVMDCCTAVATNNAGQIVVYTGESFLWVDSVLTNLGSLDNNFSFTEATAINDFGQVVGKSTVAWPSAPFLRDFAFLWQTGQIMQLPVLVDGPSDAYDINELGDVIGRSDGKPVLWTGGVVHDLTIPPYNFYGTAWRINNLGRFVGATGSPQPGHATLWNGGTTYNLNNLVPPGTPWYLLWARAINDSGQIAGEGLPGDTPYWRQAYLLQPVDCDADGDGLVGLLDYAMFRACLAGPGFPPSPQCRPLDFDRDGDVDLVDYRSLELALEPQQ